MFARWASTMRRVALVLLLGAAAQAQEQVVVHAIDGRPVCTVRLASFAGTAVGGVGFVAVDAENHDERPHTVEVGFASHPWSGCDVAARRALPLGPRERGRFFLPMPNTPGGNFGLEVRIGEFLHGTHMAVGGSPGLGGLLVSERPDLEPWGLAVMQAMPWGTTDAPEVHRARAEDLPADWRLFTAFHAVVVDGRAPLPADAQEALRRFVFAGGCVVVGEPDRLPAGALRELGVSAAADGVVAHGLGRCVAAPAGGGDATVLRARLDRLPRAGLAGWPAPEPLLQEQPVPGLGRAPVLVFLFVILVFAVLVGPVNFLLLRRWRRPLLALLTVPACGLGTTMVMLGYAFFHDGFGVRGAVRSWTLLDQERHEAASLATRTLFCGLSPNRLGVAADALVLAPRAFQHRESRAADRWHFDAATSSLDGGVLPSRRTTPLLSAQQGVTRQRLRVRPLAADRLELLTDGGVAPVGEVVLCDGDGAYWVGEAPALQRATAKAAGAAMERWRRRAGQLQVVEPGDGEQVASMHAVVARFVADGDLPRASYLAEVGQAPWLDECGLAVDYDAAQHFVVGRLAPEDFVR